MDEGMKESPMGDKQTGTAPETPEGKPPATSRTLRRKSTGQTWQASPDSAFYKESGDGPVWLSDCSDMFGGDADRARKWLNTHSMPTCWADCGTGKVLLFDPADEEHIRRLLTSMRRRMDAQREPQRMCDLF